MGSELLHTMNRKRPKYTLYVAALALTVAIFLGGYIIGEEINEYKLQHIYDLQSQIRVDSLSNELTSQLISAQECSLINISSYTSEIAEIGSKLTYLESIYGFESIVVQNLKSYYSLLLIRHMLLNEQVQTKCGTGQPALIYFYSNFKNCSDCEDQGLVLSTLHKERPEFVIYSFEYTETNSALNFIKKKYDVSAHQLPAIVYGEKSYYGFQSKSYIDSILDKGVE